MEDNTEHIEQIKSYFFERGGKYDAAIKIVLCKIVQSATPSDTIKSRRHSLLAPIKKELDPAISDWLLRNSYDSKWTFSELLNAPIPDAISVLQDLARQGHDDDWFCGNDFSRTCDALIEFLHFCGEHPSQHIPVVKLEPQKRDLNNSFVPKVGRGTELGARSNKQISSLPPYLITTYNFLRQQNLCTACGEPTLASDERERQILIAIDAATKQALESGMQFYSKHRGSLEVCGAHSEKISGSNAAKLGNRWRESFLTLLYVMRFKGVATEMNSLFNPSFEIPFARLAIQNKACQPYLKKIVRVAPNLRSEDQVDINNAVIEVIKNIKLIFDNLELIPAPYDPKPALNRIILGVQNGVTLLNANAFGIYQWRETSPNITSPTVRDL
jgi:hypothetical protein